MRRALAWLLPRSAFGGAWRGALLALLMALPLAVVGPRSRLFGCCCWRGWERLSWHAIDWVPGLLLLGVGVGLALGGALAIRTASSPGRLGAARALALAGIHAAGVAGPLACLLLDESGRRRRWIVSAVQAATPLSPSDSAARVMFVGSLGAALLLAFALRGLRRSPSGSLGVPARLGIAACGLSVAFFALPALGLVR